MIKAYLQDYDLLILTHFIAFANHLLISNFSSFIKNLRLNSDRLYQSFNINSSFLKYSGITHLFINLMDLFINVKFKTSFY